MSAGGPYWLPGARDASGTPPDVDLARYRADLARGEMPFPFKQSRASWPFPRRAIDVEMGLFDGEDRR